jgi:hypothetical protein
MFIACVPLESENSVIATSIGCKKNIGKKDFFGIRAVRGYGMDVIDSSGTKGWYFLAK